MDRVRHCRVLSERAGPCRTSPTSTRKTLSSTTIISAASSWRASTRRALSGPPRSRRRPSPLHSLARTSSRAPRMARARLRLSSFPCSSAWTPRKSTFRVRGLLSCHALPQPLPPLRHSARGRGTPVRLYCTLRSACAPAPGPGGVCNALPAIHTPNHPLTHR